VATSRAANHYAESGHELRRSKESLKHSDEFSADESEAADVNYDRKHNQAAPRPVADPRLIHWIHLCLLRDRLVQLPMVPIDLNAGRSNLCRWV